MKQLFSNYIHWILVACVCIQLVTSIIWKDNWLNLIFSFITLAVVIVLAISIELMRLRQK